MMIVIYNNSTEFNIYPVLLPARRATLINGCRCFKVLSSQIEPKTKSLTRAPANSVCISIAARPGENGFSTRGSATINSVVIHRCGEHRSHLSDPAQFIDCARRRHQRLPGPEDKHDAAIDPSATGRTTTTTIGASRR
jgi:hypothetical protein